MLLKTNTSSKNDADHRPTAQNQHVKRPLTSFNLFYRYKRIKLLEACGSGNVNADDTGSRAFYKMILEAAPGLEDCSASDICSLNKKEVEDLRRKNVMELMEDNLLPNEGRVKRAHRKTHGCMNFLEMNTAMRQAWKMLGETDEFSKVIFDELTALGREQSRARTLACNLSVDKIARMAKKSFETTTSQARAVTPEKPMLPPLSMYSMNVFNDDELVPLPIQDFSDSTLNNDNVTADDMMTFISELDEALGEVTQLASV